MALFSVDFYSKSLFRPVNFKLFVPNDVPPEMKMGNTYYERPTKILVLLHGYNGGNLDWALYSNASEISSKYNLAVILPSGENSFYLDSEATGHKYATFVGQELIDYVRNTFHLSYGILVGRNGMCVCPFHDDKNPSMKVDRRFHCFGCQADGDVIDFVSRLENVSPREAALMLAQDFSIPYEDKEPPSRSRPKRNPRKESPEQQFKRMERYCFRVLSDYHNLLRRWKRDYAPKTPEEEWHPLFVEALQKQSHVEYLLDVLLFSDIGERAALITSYGKEVRNLERRMADLAARTAAGRDGHHRSRTPAPER